MKGREYVLRPMSPIQVITDKHATHRGDHSERASHQKESERHKPNSSASTMSENKNLVLFATKREMREVCQNPSSVLHYVLLCKDNAPQANLSHSSSSVVFSFAEISRCFPRQATSGTTSTMRHQEPHRPHPQSTSSEQSPIPRQS